MTWCSKNASIQNLLVLRNKELAPANASSGPNGISSEAVGYLVMVSTPLVVVTV
jgi:hypothetical protein